MANTGGSEAMSDFERCCDLDQPEASQQLEIVLHSTSRHRGHQILSQYYCRFLLVCGDRQRLWLPRLHIDARPGPSVRPDHSADPRASANDRPIAPTTSARASRSARRRACVMARALDRPWQLTSTPWTPSTGTPPYSA